MLTILLSAVSLSCRTSIRSDGTLVQYNVLNKEYKTIILQEDCSEFTIFAQNGHTLRKGWDQVEYWEFGIMLTTRDDQTMKLSSREIQTRDASVNEIINALLFIKDRQPFLAKEIIGIENIENVIRYYGLNDTEAKSLKLLFEEQELR